MMNIFRRTPVLRAVVDREAVLQRLAARDARMRVKREKVLTDAQAGLPSFSDKLKECGLSDKLVRVETKTLQVNIGLLCNQTCKHCHVEAGPARVLENMGEKEIDRIIELCKDSSIETVDITGGAPEMNQYFRKLVKGVTAQGKKVIDRCNLTVLSLEGQEDTPQFLADHGVEVVASMPCYSVDNVDAQRGDGVFEASIEGLKKLNAVGYGTDLTLNLVYNPLGPFLPPPQKQLEAAYKEKLLEIFGISFTSLFTITNLPVKRFADDLKKENKLADYMSLLVNSFNAATVTDLMCRNTLSVSWNGKIYDCDFNQQLGMPLGVHADDVQTGEDQTIWSIKTVNDFLHKQIGLGAHCYGCTAGAGSSCGGSLA